MTTADLPAPAGLDRLRDLAALRLLPAEARVQAIAHHMCLELKQLLAVPPAHRLSPGLPLGAQGLDALDALRLEGAIRGALGTEVPAEVLRASTLDELAALLAR
ncbi:acyl carrier protein [Streptomyces sp. NPDC048420]|uniref:acyl carrier protein n=1 Tax=Streptomyces sp. NPDC048420 TaxID=3155755 RepID=UPI00341B0562